jgi:phenylalanyl-tRNA synthetase alpha chain
MTAPELDSLKAELLDAVARASDLGTLEEVRVAALGKKGRVSELMQQLGAMPPEERRSFGQAVNLLKTSVDEALETKREELARFATAEKLAQERADVTLPVREGPLVEGRIHPVSQVTDEITEIFADMGFSIAEGPDIETDFNNFTALNIPPEHPARQDHDTFYFEPEPDGTRAVLRTHTSPVQIRTMLREKPPLRIIAPGRVYRCDSDQTHTPMFHQVEGLVIDEETHLGHLKWVVEEFCKAFFEVKQVKMRFRASHFPFTEPSMEVDIGYARKGDEIKIGEGDEWLEILGCGMVHPNVLKNVGLDPERYQGFAFGLGIDRIAMLKYGMPDLRAFFRRRFALAQALRLCAPCHPHPCGRPVELRR